MMLCPFGATAPHADRHARLAKGHAGWCPTDRCRPGLSTERWSLL